MSHLKEMALHLARETKSLEGLEEKTAEVVFELGRAILKAFLNTRTMSS